MKKLASSGKLQVELFAPEFTDDESADLDNSEDESEEEDSEDENEQSQSTEIESKLADKNEIKKDGNDAKMNPPSLFGGKSTVSNGISNSNDQAKPIVQPTFGIKNETSTENKKEDDKNKANPAGLFGNKSGDQPKPLGAGGMFGAKPPGSGLFGAQAKDDKK